MRLIAALLFIGIIAASPAKACQLDKIAFGSSIDRIVSKYNLTTLTIKKEGEFIIPDRGRKICKELPEKSLVEFIFMKNHLIQVRIDNENMFGELLKYAKKVFGENDDSDRKETSDPKSDMALWNGNKSYAVIYSAFRRGKDNIELLEITSKQHKWLFDEMVLRRNSSK